MKFIQRLSTTATLFLTTLFSQSSLAYLQFTYTSQELPLLQGYRDGEVDDGIGSYDPPFPLFSASFTKTDNSQTMTFNTGDLSVGAPYPPYQLLNDVPATNSSITLNKDGIVAAWNFSLAMTQIVPESPDNPMYSRNWLVESSYGINTCNCDKLFFGADLFIERPFNTWQFIGTLGFLHGGPSDPGNWSIGEVNVPEPQPHMLFLTSLAMIMLARSRRKFIFRKTFP